MAIRRVDGSAVHAAIVTGSATVNVIEIGAYRRVDGEPVHPTGSSTVYK
jgi:hypothetical protein